MILLPSRGRPHLLRRFIDAWDRTAAKVCDVVVLLDDDDNSNDGIEYPGGWIVESRPRISIGEHLNYAVNRYGSAFYGIMNDDAIPETMGWDEVLLEGTQNKAIVWPDDCYKHGSTFPFVSGKLVGAMGFYAAPGLKHLYIDTFWGDLAKALGIDGYMPEVVVRHITYKNGAPMDETYHGRRFAGDSVVYRGINMLHYAEVARAVV